MKPDKDFEKLGTDIAERVKESFEEIMDVDALSKFIKMDKQTIYAMTSARTIPHSKPTGKLLFRKSKILKWLDENEVETKNEIEKRIGK